MARLYRDHVFRLHGLPKKIVHNRGPQFDASFMKELYKLLHIEGNPSTAYHPQTDGQTERVNQELELYLRMYVDYRQSDWSEWLALAEFAYNNREHSATGMTPFFVNTGLNPLDPGKILTTSKNLSTETFAKELKEIQKQAHEQLEKANDVMKKAHDKKATKMVQFQPGDKVMLDGRNIATTRPTKKLDDKWYGPFKVLEKIGAAAYKLELPAAWKNKHPVFNEVLLKKYIAPVFPSQSKTPPPPPILIDDEEEYEVQEILDSRFHRGTLQFLIKWTGYDETTWEPAKEIEKHAKETIQDFYRKHPGAPRQVKDLSRFLKSRLKFTNDDGCHGWSGRPALRRG